MSAGHITEHGSLTATSLNQEEHERTCGYWYTVTSGAMSHTAFATRGGLDRWLDERNLRLAADTFHAGEWNTIRIVGSYRKCSHLNEDEFAAVRPVVVTAIMDNGDYTLGLIDEDADGVRTVHYLNCNVKTRFVFDHKRTREVMS